LKIPPCVSDKCLLYPACKFKSFVECSPLHEFYLDICPSSASNTKEVWDILKVFLPNLTGIFRDKRGAQFQL